MKLQALHMLHTDTVRMMTESDKRFENIADLLGQASLLLDGKTTVLAANDKAVELFGAHIIGYPLDRFLRHPDFVEAARLAVEKNCLMQVDYTRMGYMRRDFVLRIAPFDEDRIFLAVFDATMEQSVDRIRSDFVANVSHELRSPLTALTGFIETLQDGAMDDADSRDRFLAIMQTEAQRMQRLIDDLLSLSRVEAEEHRAPREKVDLQQIIEETISAMSGMAAQNGQTIEFEIAEQLAEQELHVIGAADELRQVFQNLTENGLRYGDQNSLVRLRLSLGAAASAPLSDNFLQVQVVNQGNVIAPEHLPRLTERFYRLDKGRSRQMGGTGLGLAIVKHIVNRHRGRLRFESDNNQTVVSVSLPRHGH